jgi:hypothetical protein
VTANLEQETYLRDRVEQYRGWYDAKARRCKMWHLTFRITSLVFSFLVTLFLLAPFPSRWVVAGLAGSVFVSMGLDVILRLEDQWENYRYTEQYLDREKFLFISKAGIYRNCDELKAFGLFVERIEWAIAAENSTTLSTLALSPDGRSFTDWR